MKSFSADLYCVFGNPIAHSRSPSIHARFAALTNQSIVYERRLLQPNEFQEGVRAFIAQGGRGCNVTVPFKFDAPALAHVCSERVLLAGAANTLSFQKDGTIAADNTDGLGLVADIVRNAQVQLQDKRVLLVGAGGAAAGVLGPLLDAGVAHVTIANRTVAKAEALAASHQDIAARHGAQLSVSEPQHVQGNFDIVINATASSLAGAAVPVAASVLKPGCLAYDMMYGVAAKGFLEWATRHGAVPRDGLGMLVEQAAESFAIWRGVRPPSAQVLNEIAAPM